MKLKVSRQEVELSQQGDGQRNKQRMAQPSKERVESKCVIFQPYRDDWDLGQRNGGYSEKIAKQANSMVLSTRHGHMSPPTTLPPLSLPSFFSKIH